MSELRDHRPRFRQGPIMLDLRGFRSDLSDFPVTVEDLKQLAENPAFLALWQAGMKKLTSVHEALRGQIREGYETVVIARLNALEEVLGILQALYENGLPDQMAEPDNMERTHARQSVAEHLQETFPWLRRT